MQLVLSLSPIDEPQVEGDASEWLFHKVGGVPLLMRVIATAWKSGSVSPLFGSRRLVIALKTVPRPITTKVIVTA